MFTEHNLAPPNMAVQRSVYEAALATLKKEAQPDYPVIAMVRIHCCVCSVRLSYCSSNEPFAFAAIIRAKPVRLVFRKEISIEVLIAFNRINRDVEQAACQDTLRYTLDGHLFNALVIVDHKE